MDLFLVYYLYCVGHATWSGKGQPVAKGRVTINGMGAPVMSLCLPKYVCAFAALECTRFP